MINAGSFDQNSDRLGAICWILLEHVSIPSYLSPDLRGNPGFSKLVSRAAEWMWKAKVEGSQIRRGKGRVLRRIMAYPHEFVLLVFQKAGWQAAIL